MEAIQQQQNENSEQANPLYVSPAELRELPQWVGYKPVPQEGKKAKKLPVNPRNGEAAKVDDASTWGTFEQALAGMQSFGYPWIGFVFTENDPYFGVDQDAVRDPATGNVDPAAQLIAEDLQTYTEVSISGTGLHHIGKGKLADTGKKKDGLEVYDRRRGFVFTGDVIPGFPSTIEDRQQELDALVAEHFHSRANGRDHSRGSQKSRHNVLRLDVFGFKNAGISKEEALNLAFELTKTLNEPGARFIDEREVTNIVEWVYSRPKQDYHLTEGGLAERFVDLFGNDIRFVYKWKSYLVWDGCRFDVDQRGTVEAMAAGMIRAMYVEAAAIPDEERRKAFITHVKRSDSAKTIDAVLKLVHCKVAALPEEFDTDAYLLNVKKGVLDLRTGALLPHDRDLLMTKLAPVEFNPDATLPVWNEFIETVTAGDKAKANFLQRFAGSALIGNQRDKKVPFAIGDTDTGKTTFLEALRSTLGDYSAPGNFETFMPRRNPESPRNDLADFKGKRLIVVEEIPKGARFDEATFNRVTGGSKLKARHLHINEFEFEPTFKVIFASNNEPKINPNEPGTWARILRVPFTNKIEKPDPNIKELLRDPNVSGAAILAWMVRGCLAWQKDGLQIPEEVKQSTNDYHKDSDGLKDFIEQECVLKPDAWIESKTLWDKYQQFCKDSNERFALKRDDFNQALRRRGAVPKSSRGEDSKMARGWLGIRLKTECDASDEGSAYSDNTECSTGAYSDNTEFRNSPLDDAIEEVTEITVSSVSSVINNDSQKCKHKIAKWACSVCHNKTSEEKL